MPLELTQETVAGMWICLGELGKDDTGEVHMRLPLNLASCLSSLDCKVSIYVEYKYSRVSREKHIQIYSLNFVCRSKALKISNNKNVGCGYKDELKYR